MSQTKWLRSRTQQHPHRKAYEELVKLIEDVDDDHAGGIAARVMCEALHKTALLSDEHPEAVYEELREVAFALLDVLNKAPLKSAMDRMRRHFAQCELRRLLPNPRAAVYRKAGYTESSPGVWRSGHHVVVLGMYAPLDLNFKSSGK